MFEAEPADDPRVGGPAVFTPKPVTQRQPSALAAGKQTFDVGCRYGTQPGASAHGWRFYHLDERTQNGVPSWYNREFNSAR